MRIGVSRPAASTPPVIWPAVPEDDTTPETPLQVFLKCDVQTSDSDLALSAYSLRLGQFGRPF